MAFFVMMVGNEVVESYSITDEDAERIPPLGRRMAILRSRPTIRETDVQVEVGKVWNGSAFVDPE